ncbi:DUF192 domain-containing protein [Patescibacteria group bacterium]|nr:DUF192 domain-containing protein [Patescibacteria group bacterium]
MQIRNETQNVVLSDDALYFRTLAEKANGLIDIDDEKKAAYFNTRFGIHTFGMDRSLDCLVLDDAGHVKRIKEGLLPNKTFFWPPIWKRVVELPAGRVRETGTSIGDKISIV